MLLRPSELAACEARTAGRLLRRSAAAHISTWHGASWVQVPKRPGAAQIMIKVRRRVSFSTTQLEAVVAVLAWRYAVY
eukprot:1492844-Rhodomonas_salina.1